jgi:hypothetical protein
MSDEDPEVLADLRFRESSARDRTRTGETRWTPPKVVDRVPCRGRCGSVVEWTEEAEEAFTTWNRVLAKRDEAPLDRTRIVFCNACRAEGARAGAERNRKMVDAIAGAIRELKDGCESHREHELLDKLERAGHPDIPGLKQWLREKNAKGSKRVTRGAL